jgi:hypothetical protein
MISVVLSSIPTLIALRIVLFNLVNRSDNTTWSIYYLQVRIKMADEVFGCDA